MSPAADPRVVMLAKLREPACRLGMAFAAAAEQAEGTDKWLEYFHAFDRCFFSARVAIALELRLERVSASSAQPRTEREDLSDREALLEREPDEAPERYEPEYDRERESEIEPASFPILLRALDGVVEAAAALPGPEPAELPTLRELIARVKAQPQPESASRPPLRTRLAGSAAALAQRRTASNVGAVLAARRATGPPRR